MLWLPRKGATVSLVSIPAFFDGKEIKLLEMAPVEGPYRVLVTFIEASPAHDGERDLSRFWASFGAWKDDRTTEEISRDMHASRRSRPEPPHHL